MDRAGKPLKIDAGQALRYAADTQDEAYRSGAYDFVESLDLAPRMAVIASYLRRLGARRILDLGCGTGLLLEHLPAETTYVGLDISPTAVAAARARFADRPGASFHAAAFANWRGPRADLDCVVWAGIGRTWTRGGKRGRFEDWLDVLDRAETWLVPEAHVVLEMVAPHWDNLAPLIAGRYEYLAGCDLDCLRDDHRAVRAVRVFRRIAAGPAGRRDGRS